MTEEGQEQLYSTRTKGDEMLLLNGVPEEQEKVDDGAAVRPRENREEDDGDFGSVERMSKMR